VPNRSQLWLLSIQGQGREYRDADLKGLCTDFSSTATRIRERMKSLSESFICFSDLSMPVAIIRIPYQQTSLNTFITQGESYPWQRENFSIEPMDRANLVQPNSLEAKILIGILVERILLIPVSL